MENGKNNVAKAATTKPYEVRAKVLKWGTKDGKGTPKKEYKRGDKIELTDAQAKVLKSKFLIK